ncbi:MAG TPA: hypothetical protein DIW43_18985 [Spongiibacteraceae bacterium]|nr:hypothetical protein [Spongiibacteraceae bacterium]MBN51744.1 hypothetical protein [Spongiibacteraceae bacterium]HCS29548.1 hypothetical protein [Spongiibacteraceae bacterium]|tara:strand:+ start:524 stop:1072 length:549 start_codon:yes stop_codon:yes gene_type:complete
MNTRPIIAICLLVIGLPAFAGTMTLKIPLKVVLMNEAVHSAKIMCEVYAGAEAQRRVSRGFSEFYPLDAFGNLNVTVPIAISLERFDGLQGSFLQNSPSYACIVSFYDENNSMVLTTYSPDPTTEAGQNLRSQLINDDKSVMMLEVDHFAPDPPSQLETTLGGRRNNLDTQLQQPQNFRLQR